MGTQSSLVSHFTKSFASVFNGITAGHLPKDILWLIEWVPPILGKVIMCLYYYKKNNTSEHISLWEPDVINGSAQT